MPKHSLLKLMVVLAAMLHLAGCATSASNTASLQYRSILNNTKQQQVIAEDMVFLLKQLPDTAPYNTTVQFGKSKNKFGKALLAEIESSGYGVQLVSADQGANFVYYQMQASGESGYTSGIKVSLNIGDLSISRTYAVKNKRVVPTSTFVVEGSDPVYQLIDNASFSKNETNSTASGVRFLNLAGDTVARINMVAANTRPEQSEWQAGAFSEDDHIVTRVLKIQMRSGSLSLGASNKAAIKHLLEYFDEKQDLMMISACPGPAQKAAKNELSKSVGNKNRIRSELLVSGVKSNQISEAGCEQSEFKKELLPGVVAIALKKPRSTAL